MVDNTNAKSEAQSVRSEQIGEVPSPSNAEGEEWTRISSNSDGNFGGRTFREAGTGGDSGFSLLAGGILSQLIKDAEDQLGEARECIEWYSRKEKEQVERLENLRKLQELEQHLLEEPLEPK